MFLERLEVEGGFLDELNVGFSPGLNTVIGSRGVGKTSVVELIRYCLALPAYTPRVESAALEHATAVLGDGRVTLTIRGDGEGERILVSRGADEDSPRYSAERPGGPPIVLSQNEIELVGLDPAGRLRIIDGFRSATGSSRAEERELLAAIRSLTTKMQHVAQELEGKRDELARLDEVSAELQDALTIEAQVVASLSGLQEEQSRLAEISSLQATAAVRRGVFERTKGLLESWLRDLEVVTQQRPRLEDWPTGAGSEDGLKAVRESLEKASHFLDQGLEQVRSGLSEVATAEVRDEEQHLAVAEEARKLRRQLEAAHEGAGRASQRVAALRERLASLSALAEAAKQQEEHLRELQKSRQQLLDGLDELREDRYTERAGVAETLSRELGPRIRVQVTRFGLYADYANAIAASLRGSGLHYSELAPQLASNLSPRELVEAVEAGDASSISSYAGITLERAQRVIDYLRAEGPGGILTTGIDDSVVLELLDGTDYKDTEHLSTGQRCTVVLPILLGHSNRTLIIDQPEDHLDNAFIVDTLIHAIRRHSKGGQLIFTTHNANIPVLGDAAQVIVLNSDGQRGFLEAQGPLNDSPIVEAITSVMEGGLEAFQKRAQFYKNRGLLAV